MGNKRRPLGTKELWKVREHFGDGYYESISIISHGKELAEFHSKDDADRAVACVNGCKGINPAAVGDLLEALRALYSYPGVRTLLAPTDSLGSVAKQVEAAITKTETKEKCV